MMLPAAVAGNNEIQFKTKYLYCNITSLPHTDFLCWLQWERRGVTATALSPTDLIVFRISSEQLKTLSLISLSSHCPVLEADVDGRDCVLSAVFLPSFSTVFTSLEAMASMDLTEWVTRSTGWLFSDRDWLRAASPSASSKFSSSGASTLTWLWRKVLRSTLLNILEEAASSWLAKGLL